MSQPEHTVNTVPPQNSKKRRRGKVMTTLVLLMLLAGGAWAGYWYMFISGTESTDDAYVAGNIFRVMPQVGGKVVAVLADDNDRVLAGQPLVRLDDVDARLAYDRAQVDLAAAVRSTCSLITQFRETEAVINMREVDLRQSRDNLARREVLARRNAIGVEELHNSRNTVETAAAALAVAHEQKNRLKAQLLDTALDQQPAVRQAAAVVRERWLALHRTEIKSPVNGQVAKRAAQAGEVVNPGTPLVVVAALDRLWIDANFKELQLRNIRINQPVTVTVDLYGTQVVYHGRVAGFSAGTGSAFALLPAQNATGNWIKIVQRVPVRIEIDQTELKSSPLLIGLSALVDVDITDTSGPLLATAPRVAELPEDLGVKDVGADFTAVEALIAGIIQANAASALAPPVVAKD